MRINSVPDVKCFFVIIKMCYVHNQWYDISCATLYIWGVEFIISKFKLLTDESGSSPLRSDRFAP